PSCVVYPPPTHRDHRIRLLAPISAVQPAEPQPNARPPIVLFAMPSGTRFQQIPLEGRDDFPFVAHVTGGQQFGVSRFRTDPAIGLSPMTQTVMRRLVLRVEFQEALQLFLARLNQSVLPAPFGEV